MDITIQLAATQDLEMLCKLYVEFHEFHVLGVPDRLLSLGNPDTYDCSGMYPDLEKIMNDTNASLFLAKLGQRLVGLAHVFIKQDEPNPAVISRRYGYLQSLMVREEYRHQDIGTRLIERVHQWAKEQGVIEVHLDTWEFVEGPLQFYEKLGYRTLRRTLVREL